MKRKKITAIIVALVLLFQIALTGCGVSPENEEKNFRIISSDENKDLENNMKKYAKSKGIDLTITYYGTIDMMEILNAQSDQYDGVWLSNSIWLYMLKGETKAKIKDSRFTSVNPIIFGVDTDKAKELGFYERDDVALAEIINAVAEKKLSFIMPSATQTNSGASAYLSFLNALAGSPQILTEEHLKDETLQNELKSLFSGVSRSSGSEEYGMEMYLQGGYEALVGYESTIINLNQQLVKSGKKPVYAIYPKDGVSVSDSPFAYIDNGIESKEEEFDILQSYLLSGEMQSTLTETGRRGGYGGIVDEKHKEVFNSAWGINSSTYLAPIKYPNSQVIMSALNLYQTELRKPSVTVFCLDYSGSMSGKGYEDLSSAMEMVLNPDLAAERLIQFSSSDIIYVSFFDGEIRGTISREAGGDITNSQLISEIYAQRPTGGTDIYSPVISGFDELSQYDPTEYNLSIILMTDGQSNVSMRSSGIKNIYKQLSYKYPVFCIMFGDADPDQLDELAELTGGMVFDGSTSLVHAFQTVRAYN